MAKKTRKQTERKPALTTRPGPERSPLFKYLPAAFLGLVLLVVAVTFLQQQRQIKEALSVTDTVRIETSKGEVVVEVYPKLAPITVENFKKLVKEEFYDGLKWHRVEDWVVQTGDPLGTGEGGSSETIPLEISRVLKNRRGMLGMARTLDPNSASSQFYVLKTDAPWLDGGYAVFGKVVSGMDAIDQLTTDDIIVKATLETESPE
ncbi:MAG: peptidylprolyl isomerase [Bacillota bacterium]|jgi:peptidyl-prolyl cis-trans isomerase B (cyclophilin B)|nr:peptidylprolyl isomerase [Candidatus Fermentithermobacillaceae bacterium]